MRKRKIILILCVFLLLLFFYYKFVILEFLFSWKINISFFSKIIYKDEYAVSWNGDGYYYYVIKTYGKSDIGSKHFKSNNYEEKLLDILKKMDIKEKFYPDFSKDYGFYLKERKDGSYIYIFKFDESNLIFIFKEIV